MRSFEEPGARARDTSLIWPGPGPRPYTSIADRSDAHTHVPADLPQQGRRYSGENRLEPYTSIALLVLVAAFFQASRTRTRARTTFVSCAVAPCSDVSVVVVDSPSLSLSARPFLPCSSVVATQAARAQLSWATGGRRETRRDEMMARAGPRVRPLAPRPGRPADGVRNPHRSSHRRGHDLISISSAAWAVETLARPRPRASSSSLARANDGSSGASR